jgi:putative acetyltransferase
MSPIIVRRIEERDIDEVTALYAFESVLGMTSQIPHRGPEFWGSFYRQRDPEGIELVAEIDGRAVGHLGILMNHGARRRHVASFGIAVHPDHHGRGVGSALMSELVNLADNWLNLVRIELSVASDNTRAIALYEKFGFASEGEARCDSFLGGRYTSSLRMARLRPGADQVAVPTAGPPGTSSSGISSKDA